MWLILVISITAMTFLFVFVIVKYGNVDNVKGGGYAKYHAFSQDIKNEVAEEIPGIDLDKYDIFQYDGVTKVKLKDK